jgi:cation diffusion facilitator CzcD-associated flavoprotein CzcO
MNMSNPTARALRVAVVGAGPIGLGAAAHLVQRGIGVEVYEAGAGVATHLDSYAHVRLFSPWHYNVDLAGRELLEGSGWSMPDPNGLQINFRYQPEAAHRPSTCVDT